MQGYVVFSVEHTDGTASAARLAHGGGWLFYQGWGSEEGRMAQTRCTTPGPIPPLLSSRGPLPFPHLSLFLSSPIATFLYAPATCRMCVVIMARQVWAPAQGCTLLSRLTLQDAPDPLQA